LELLTKNLFVVFVKYLMLSFQMMCVKEFLEVLSGFECHMLKILKSLYYLRLL
jgi:hypothetical protein